MVEELCLNVIGDQSTIDDTETTVDPLATVLTHLQTRNLLVNRAGRGCITLPGDRRVISLESQDALCWLAADFYRTTNSPPTKSQLSSLVLILRGLAGELPLETSADGELWDRIDDEPVIQAVMAYLESSEKGYFQGTMTDLRTVLTETARQRHIFYPSTWPPTANQLGRRLNALEPILRAAGYALTRQATNTTRTVYIGPIDCGGDDGSRQSSPVTSPRNSDDGKLLGFGDDGDDSDSRTKLRQDIERTRHHS